MRFSSVITIQMARCVEHTISLFRGYIRSYSILRQVLFNIFSAQKNSRPWGEFELDTDVSSSGLAGPKYVEPIDPALSAYKVSDVNPSKKWDTVLLARLRFKPDVPEPTSL